MVIPVTSEAPAMLPASRVTGLARTPGPSERTTGGVTTDRTGTSCERSSRTISSAGTANAACSRCPDSSVERYEAAKSARPTETATKATATTA